MDRKVERTGEVKGVGGGCPVQRFHVLWRMTLWGLAIKGGAGQKVRHILGR